MLPTEDSAWVGEELSAPLRPAAVAVRADRDRRQPVRDPARARRSPAARRSSSINWCYHGTVDETFARGRRRATVSRPGNIGPPVDPGVTTTVVEWNDVDGAGARRWRAGDVACVLAEPAMTNIGIVLPEPGYHDALRALTREHGTLLVIDETHTICAGPGGYTAAHGPRARLPHDRQAARRRGAGRGLRDERARSPTASLEHSDARGLRRRRHRRHARRATRSRWRRCGRRSRTSSPTRPSSG